MGQQISMTRKNKRKAQKLYDSLYFANGNNSLSYTFAVLDDQPNAKLINVNLASENELMTVRDISLELAKNIVKHRKTIGYYQKVEDLVVVPGMGAERFDRIRHQVCTTSKNVLRTSWQSFDSLRTVDSRTTISKLNRVVNINVASVFDLQLVPGITQEIAAGIVYYRNKKGPFKRLEDLHRVKCIDNIRLDNISRYLTVQNDEEDNTFDLEPESLSYQSHLNGHPAVKEDSLKYINTNGGTNRSTFSDIFELLSIYSPRPITKEIFQHSRNDKPAFRVSFWNLENFSLEKASNLGVREVVCRTILENGWSILVVQNIEDEGAIKLICEELNNPKLCRVKEWKYNRHQWKYDIQKTRNSNFGIIFDASEATDTEVICSTKVPSELREYCETLAMNFQIQSSKFQVLNMKIYSESGCPALREYFQKIMNSHQSCLICGDFGFLMSDLDFFTTLENSKLLLPSVNVLNNMNSRNKFRKSCTLNFLLNTSFQYHYTGLNGIVRNGLTHLAIPSGWSWGGAVSSFCPIWAEFFVNSNVNL